MPLLLCNLLVGNRDETIQPGGFGADRAITQYEKLLATYNQEASVPPFKVIDLDIGELEQAAEKAQQGHYSTQHTERERERESKAQSYTCVLSYLLKTQQPSLSYGLRFPRTPQALFKT